MLSPPQRLLFSTSWVGPWHMYFTKAPAVILIVPSLVEKHCPLTLWWNSFHHTGLEKSRGRGPTCNIFWDQVTWDSVGISTAHLPPPHKHSDLFLHMWSIDDSLWWNRALNICLWPSFQMECDDPWDSQTNPIDKRTSWNGYTPIWGNYCPAVIQAKDR